MWFQVRTCDQDAGRRRSNSGVLRQRYARLLANFSGCPAAARRTCVISPVLEECITFAYVKSYGLGDLHQALSHLSWLMRRKKESLEQVLYRALFHFLRS